MKEYEIYIRCNVNLKYYCIKEREVFDFSIYSEEETIAKKIIYFQNYKNNYRYIRT